MKLIVGLGNPGEKYVNTRHNIGFQIVDTIAGKKEISFNLDKKFEAEVGEWDELKFIKPQTFMNESGRAVQKVVSFYKIVPQEMIVIHDDVDLEEGKIKIVSGGSSAGHKGIQSIIDNIGTEDFWRVRIGVGRSDQIPTEDWVLKNFEDKNRIMEIIDKLSSYMIESLSNELISETINF